MSKTNSPVAICNMALSHLNQSPITSIESPSSEVEDLCNLYYDQTRLELLRTGAWNFAIKRTSLAQLSSTPSFGYSYEYLLPIDFVRLLTIGQTYIVNDYELEDGKILITDLGGSATTALPIRYIFDQTDVAKFDPLFIKVLSLHLALVLNKQITGSSTEQDRILQLIQRFEDEARTVDGQERPPTQVNNSRLMTARLGYMGIDNSIVRVR